MTNMVNVDLDDREEKVRGYFLGKISQDEKTFTRVNIIHVNSI